jgi:hypothetical protein
LKPYALRFKKAENKPPALSPAVMYSARTIITMMIDAGIFEEVKNPVRTMMSLDVTNSCHIKITIMAEEK